MYVVVGSSGYVMVCYVIVVVVGWRCMIVARVVLVLGWWRWVYGSRSDDSIMVYVWCYPGSSGGVVVYMVIAVVVVGWCVCVCVCLCMWMVGVEVVE